MHALYTQLLYLHYRTIWFVMQPGLECPWNHAENSALQVIWSEFSASVLFYQLPATASFPIKYSYKTEFSPLFRAHSLELELTGPTGKINNILPLLSEYSLIFLWLLVGFPQQYRGQNWSWPCIRQEPYPVLSSTLKIIINV